MARQTLPLFGRVQNLDADCVFGKRFQTQRMAVIGSEILNDAFGNAVIGVCGGVLRAVELCAALDTGRSSWPRGSSKLIASLRFGAPAIARLRARVVDGHR